MSSFVNSDQRNIWNLIPNNIELEPTLELFKKKIRNGNGNPVHVECVKPVCNM